VSAPRKPGSGGTTAAEQEHLEDLAIGAAEAEERRATGQRQFRTVHQFWRTFFATRESWSAPKAMPLQVETGRPSRGAENPSRVRQARGVAILRALEADERARAAEAGEAPAPVELWLGQHHLLGRAYAFMAEESGRSLDVVKKRMARWHRLTWDELTVGLVQVKGSELEVVPMLEEEGDDGE
jgi:hypothetical protein